MQTNSKGAMVTVLALNKPNTVLVSGDSTGFIYIWDIEGYAATEAELSPPDGKYIWKGIFVEPACGYFDIAVTLLFDVCLCVRL